MAENTGSGGSRPLIVRSIAARPGAGLRLPVGTPINNRRKLDRVALTSSANSAARRLDRGGAQGPTSTPAARIGQRVLGGRHQGQPGAGALGFRRLEHLGVAVEGVEGRGQLSGERGDALGLLEGCRILDDLREAHDLACQAAFCRAADRAPDRGGRLEPGLVCPAQDRGDPGMGVLDVVDRVLARLLLGQLDVEVDSEVGARDAKNQRAASTPTSSRSWSRVMNVPARLLIETSTPSTTKRTQAIRSIRTASRS